MCACVWVREATGYGGITRGWQHLSKVPVLVFGPCAGVRQETFTV